MTKYIWAATTLVGALTLLVGTLVWADSGPSGQLEGTTAHVTIRQHTDVPWANFKLELWNQKSGKSTLWHLKIDTEGGCHMEPLGDGAVQHGT